MNILVLLLFAFLNELIGIVIGMELWEKLDEYAESEEINMYSIINQDKRNGHGDDMLIVAEDQLWTSEDCEQLKREENIFYNRGVFAIQKIKRMNSNPLLRIAIEDDGHILFNDDHCISFDSYWLDDLLNVLDEVERDNKE